MIKDMIGLNITPSKINILRIDKMKDWRLDYVVYFRVRGEKEPRFLIFNGTRLNIIIGVERYAPVTAEKYFNEHKELIINRLMGNRGKE
jgi:hypothetical protein